jgi:hypothetical protein
MGDTLHIVVRDTRTCPGPGDDNSIMLALQSWLDALCTRLGVAKLSDFVDDSGIAAELMEWMREDTGEGLTSEDELPDPEPAVFEPRWFDAGPALAAVRALVAHLEERPEDLGFRPDPSRAHWPGQLMEELRGCESALGVAVATGQPFRFLLVT